MKIIVAVIAVLTVYLSGFFIHAADKERDDEYETSLNKN